jgi:acetyl-CoA carboxylase carboxyltransferase component
MTEFDLHGRSQELILATMPGLVVHVAVAIGDRVEVGDLLCVTETMKCESAVTADTAGWVTAVLTLGDVVELGAVLVRVEAFPPSPHRRLWSPTEVLDLLCAPVASCLPGVELPEAASGRFVEHDLDDGTLVPVTRPPGEHEGAIVVGVISHRLRGHEDGLERVLICGDPTRSMGAVAEGECRRIIAALELARRRNLSVEWVAVSGGARIAWDSGTENMDWCAEVARYIVEFTQGGGAINVIVAGVNVGAQSYWNALATMLWHDCGVLIMVAEHAMVLTGRRALQLSGGGSHDDEAEMGGYAAVMGPNGEAHHVVTDLPAAYRLLFDHLSLCEPVSTGRPPWAPTSDGADRSICDSPYSGIGDFTTVGDVLRAESNGSRKRPFAIRPVMAALADADATTIERWPDQRGAGAAVVWDTRIGGWPVALLGVESQPLPDPEQPVARYRAAGTLFPQASRKLARALNAASGRRGAVILANLAGFDGSAESMLGRQLEYGAEIARAVVNFRGPVVVVIIGRFHGGAYVVFSQRLNPSVTTLAIDGTFVSVIGGEAAAGVIFSREVTAAVDADLALETSSVSPVDRRRRALELGVEHRSRIARRFDDVHSVHRAAEMGSVDRVIAPDEVRSRVVKLLDGWGW